jgi:VWFA-related protein
LDSSNVNDYPERQNMDQTDAVTTAFEQQQEAMRLDIRVKMTVDALAAIGQQLSGYPGRKKLIWVSGGFPVALASPVDEADAETPTTTKDMGITLTDRMLVPQGGPPSQRSYADKVEQVVSLLRKSQVALYAIDPAGLTGSQADMRSMARGRNGRQLIGGALGEEAQRQANLVAESHATAKQLADGTGGLYFYNSNDLDGALKKSVDDASSYYALSYYPGDKEWDGKFRKIEIKVDRPGVELRYRKGYFASAEHADKTMAGKATISREVNLAMMTALTATSVTLYGSAQPPEQSKSASGPEVQREVRFLVEPNDIMFPRAQDGRVHCNVEFVVGVFISDKLKHAVDKHMECNLKAAEFESILHEGLIFGVQVPEPEGKLRIRMIVRDNLTGKIGSLDLPYPPVAAVESATTALPN